MIFLQFFRQLDDLLYEVMSWGVFYPVTLGRVVRHPVRMMDYADSELSDAPERQYPDVLSPPLFLLLSVLLAHAIELAVFGSAPPIPADNGLSRLLQTDTNLVLFRLVCFAAFPLVTATALLVAKGTKINRSSLKMPFYAQCYAAAAFALLFSFSGTLIRLHWTAATVAGVVIVLIAIPAYLVVQTLWFRRHLESGLGKAFSVALVAYILSLGVLGLVTPLVA
ncbi:hypothetical protein [Sphingomonas sp. AX6]|uniref:hypothetical protein n=1 Tax=Sphingomonas sp. AX6 TaxID=2653171 RepID=UPI0012F253C5|nr:hypothetical protein [Sphingomonas sp. AX6]VXC92971.1 conserved membrane hypothetical protein [Sphingomonas sp. AX6]